MSGKKIIEGLEDALAGRFTTTTLPASPELTLEPCPFCGASDVGVGASQEMDDNDEYLPNRRWSVLCRKCGASCSLYCESEGAAITAWNTRHRSSPSSAWRDIKDAPKDGTPIIGGYFDVPWAESHMKGRVVKCWYQPEFSAFISSCREMSLATGYTFKDGSTKELHSPEIETVSHFMPYSEPPK